MIYDMINGSFPIPGPWRSSPNETNVMLNTNLSSIDLIIDIDQMANYINSDSVHFHSEPEDSNKDKIDNFYKVMERIASNERPRINLKRESPLLPLPPTPVQEFIRYSRDYNHTNQNRLTGLVLSNYGNKFSNLLYHSIYDDSHNIFQNSRPKLVDHIARVSKFIAKSVFEIAFQTDKTDEISVDETLVKDLLECYLIDAQCRLFTRATTAGQRLPTGPIETYKDPTKSSDDMNGVITAHLLAYFIGDKIPEYNATQCLREDRGSAIYNFAYINDKDEPITDGVSGVCIRSQVSMLSGFSPAFSFSDGIYHIDARYPAWTVSLNGIRNPVRLYLKPSPLYQWTIFILGILVTIISFMITFQFKKNVLGSKLNTPVNSQMATPT